VKVRHRAIAGKSSMSTLKALLFDVDGTLADTEREGHMAAFNRSFDEAGLNWHWGANAWPWKIRITA
jgi:FMN phosphatase YigB (HAD superfamily)